MILSNYSVIELRLLNTLKEIEILLPLPTRFSTFEFSTHISTIVFCVKSLIEVSVKGGVWDKTSFLERKSEPQGF